MRDNRKCWLPDSITLNITYVCMRWLIVLPLPLTPNARDYTALSGRCIGILPVADIDICKTPFHPAFKHLKAGACIEQSNNDLGCRKTRKYNNNLPQSRQDTLEASTHVPAFIATQIATNNVALKRGPRESSARCRGKVDGGGVSSLFQANCAPLIRSNDDNQESGTSLQPVAISHRATVYRHRLPPRATASCQRISVVTLRIDHKHVRIRAAICKHPTLAMLRLWCTYILLHSD